MLSLLIRKKRFIAIITIIFMLISISPLLIMTFNNAEMTISINYPGAEKGQNPDGTRFNIFELTSDEVLQKTVEKLNIPNLTVDFLKTRINIYPIIPKDINEKIKNFRITGDNFSYFPNEYTVQYSQKSKFAKNHTRELLNTLGECYKEYFIDNYAEKNLTSAALTYDTSNCEYVEISDVLTAKVNSVISYLNAKNSQNSTFRSDTTGETFGNLIDDFTNLRDVDIFNMNSFVNTSQVAKNRSQLIQKMKYDVVNMQLNYDKMNGEAAASKSAVEQYDSSVIKNIYIPSIDQNHDLYMNKTKTGLDHLMTQSLDSEVRAENIKKDLDNKKNLITSFENSKVSDEENARLSAKAEQMISDINGKFAQLVKVAQNTINDYANYKTKDYLIYTVSPISAGSFFNMNYLITILSGGIIGFLLACSYLLLRNLKTAYPNLTFGNIHNKEDLPVDKEV